MDLARSTEGGSGSLSRPLAFSAITAIFVVFAAAASAPTPLYIVYQREWGFPTSTLTVIFAVYVVGLIGYSLRAAEFAGIAIRYELLTGVSIPFVVLLVWFGLRRLRRSPTTTELSANINLLLTGGLESDLAAALAASDEYYLRATSS